MPREIPPLTSVTATALRRTTGWTEGELAAASGIPRKRISRFESGELEPSREELEAMTAALGKGPEAIDLVLLGLQAAEIPADPTTPADPSPAELGRIRRAAGRLSFAMFELMERRFTQLARTRSARRAHRIAAGLWQRLQDLPSERCWLLVEKAREFQTWALAVRLAVESEKAAADSADRALDLARLAVRVAELAPGGAAWRSQLLGFVHAFLSNALRVHNDLPGADATFRRAWELWKEGEEVGSDLLPVWRLLDLEASLRRAQRHWAEALGLLDRARAVAPPEALGRILLKRSSVLVLQGEGERAVEVLCEAAPLVDGRREPRLLWVLRFNLAANLVLLERFRESEVLLPEVLELAIGLGNELDLARCLWLRCQVDAGLGRSVEAMAAFQQVLREFIKRELPYDAALVALELSVLYLEQGRTAEVKLLAKEMAWIFDAQGVDEETLKALTVFREAAERDAVTADLARRLFAQINLARLLPGKGPPKLG
ncbi:MAG TPA: helix-turn-helix domain-containing protein [Thermoanaerobaculia bacterium]|nr:helix-turn-helix domain-containing protein [Thermoanaerobaculia bacterium]